MAERKFENQKASDDRLTSAAATLGYEIVDIAGFLDLVETHAADQSNGLHVLQQRAGDLTIANTEVLKAVKSLVDLSEVNAADIAQSAEGVRRSGDKSQNVARWVQEVSGRTATVSETISDVRSNNQQIASIATQVNTLAINAKIEAARAGEAGRGFAVVAEAINELSRRTSAAAVEISNNIETLTGWIAALGDEAGEVSTQAAEVLVETSETDTALKRLEASIVQADTQSKKIAEQAGRVEVSMRDFAPALSTIGDAIEGTTSGIKQTHERVLRLIDTSETIVQSTALLAPDSEDARFVTEVKNLAREISSRMEKAVTEGLSSASRLFDRTYRPIPNTDPEQFLTEATTLLDELLPPIQEPALQLSPKIVFCAAVDVNGYLPTHNKKFSQPLGNDPVWNTANCRNRRIFDDRVGLKAGRNKEPFLLQVYRRDMGGGTFKMMKDLSAPIFVQGQHWGGLRLAYGFD